VRNNERYLAFSPAVSEAFLEVSDLLVNFFLFTFSIRINRGFERKGDRVLGYNIIVVPQQY
jgi:hypothetical protein